MQTSTIAVVGAGNMGASLVGGLIATGFPAEQIWLTDPDLTKLQDLKQQFNVNVTTNNQEAAAVAHVIILAVKPQTMADVAKNLVTTLHQSNPLIISVAAGIRIAHLQNWFGEKAALVRCMPNTPALIRCGITALYATKQVSSEQRNLAESILQTAGTTVWLDDETQMDAVTALSGSGPAYFFLLIETLQEIGEGLGLSTTTANKLTLQTALGAARMAIESPKSVTELRRNVTSPGGTTEAALRVLEEGNIRHLFKQALQAAKNRSEELAHQIEK